MNVRDVRYWIAIISLIAGCTAGAEAPTVNQADDPQHFASPTTLLTWTPAEQVAGYRNAERIFPTRPILAGAAPLALPLDLQDLTGLELTRGERSLSLSTYLTRQSVAGLLVIKNGKILYEYYGLGNDDSSRWISFSVTKSVVSLLIGAAIQDGYIDSAEDKVTRYLPKLQGSAYDDASIADLLQMASGVTWNEDYADPDSDIATATWDTLSLYDFLRNKPRVAQPGKTFNYNTAETNLAGTLLRSAIGNNLSTYLSQKIWQPFGMEHDARWNLTETGGGEFGGCCISATLRDYGRIGLFALANGQLADGTRVLPANWMERSTTPSRGNDGYGYFWWL
ncbi:MAG: serine hydrolase domain-containing protein, partial [Pseudomonadota bacterium]